MIGKTIINTWTLRKMTYIVKLFVRGCFGSLPFTRRQGTRGPGGLLRMNCNFCGESRTPDRTGFSDMETTCWRPSDGKGSEPKGKT